MVSETEKALIFLTKRDVLSEKFSHVKYVFLLVNYLEHQGEDMLQALAGFYLYVIKNVTDQDKQHRMLVSTFMHDLLQAEDELMLPRSSDYQRFWTNR